MSMPPEEHDHFIRRHLPGVADIAEGRIAFGLSLLALFLVCPALIVLRFDLFIDGVNSLVLTHLLAVLDAAKYRTLARYDLTGQWIAVLSLVIVPLLVWFYHRRRYRRRRSTAAAGSRGLIARMTHMFGKSRQAVAGLFGIVVLYVVALAAPFVAPYSPVSFQDGSVTQFRPPFSSVLGIRLRPLPPPELPSAANASDATLISRVYRTAWLANSRLAGAMTPRVMYVDSVRVERDSVISYNGITRSSIPWSSLVSTDPGEFIFRDHHLLGTDSYGRDILSRLIFGAQVSLTLSIVAVLLSGMLGTIIGLSAGYFGRATDIILMRFVDMMLAFPSFFLILICIAMFESVAIPRFALIMIIIGLTSWMGVARLVRGEVLSLRERQYVLAARALGLGNIRILFRHILPNTLSPVIVNTTLRTGGIILLEAALSFLNLGVQPPTPSWGNIVYEGKDYIAHAWWISTTPGLVIALTVLAFNLIGDGLRDALDPVQAGG